MASDVGRKKDLSVRGPGEGRDTNRGDRVHHGRSGIEKVVGGSQGELVQSGSLPFGPVDPEIRRKGAEDPETLFPCYGSPDPATLVHERDGPGVFLGLKTYPSPLAETYLAGQGEQRRENNKDDRLISFPVHGILPDSPVDGGPGGEKAEQGHPYLL